MLAAALLVPAAPLIAAPEIAASIKPLQLIAAAITQGISTPAVVWSQGQDPHHVSLRPSERRMLANADLVLWTGPMLEQPLVELVRELDAEILTVQNLQGLVLLEVDGEPDPHVWVDTRNARLIATMLAETLTRLDPANAEAYGANLMRFHDSLTALTADIEQRLGAARGREWAVYHHALRYLEQEFGLREPLALADSENNAPGLRTAVQVRAQLQQKDISCMLTEPGTNHDEVATMLDLPALRLVEADVMGRGPDATDYVSYLRTLVVIVSDCLEVAR